MRDSIRRLLNEVYERMTPEELEEVHVIPLNHKGDIVYAHSDIFKESVFKRSVGVEVMKSSIDSQLRMIEKGLSHEWTPEDIAKYAKKMADAMYIKFNDEG